MTDIKNGEENVVIFKHVGALDSLAAAINEGPANIDVASNAVTYDMSSLEDADLKDRVAYQATAFTEETKALEQMADLLRQGHQFISLLYSYRSCSKALPMVQGDEADTQRIDVHKKTFEVLRPEIIKLRQLMDFHEMAVLNIKNNVGMIVKMEQKKAIHSESLLDHIVKAIDMLIILDALKDMKACLLNDFSRYKRAFAPIRGDLPDHDAISEEIHNLQMFLGNPQQPHNLIMFHLKTDLQKVAGYDGVVSILIDHCADCIYDKKYLTPTELHTYYRVIPYLFYCMDGDEKRGGVNPFKGKLKFNISRIQKLFKAFPIIPLYGDMQIDVMFVLKRCQHWEDEIMVKEWTTAKPQKLHQRYELLYNRQRIRAEYNKYTMDFTALMNDIKAVTLAKKMITPAMLQKTYKTTLEGLQLLSAWSAKIAEQSAWKYAHPVTEEEYRKQGGKGEPGHEYEKVVRCNYNSEELYALIDVIGMIKGLGGLMMHNEVTLVPLLRRCIHDDLQIFLQQEVARPLRKAHKRNRKVKDVMLQLREIGCDWINREQQKDDYLQKKKELIQANRDFPRRATAPTLTQIELIRRMMHTIFSPKSAGMQGGMFTDKDLKKEWIPVWESFYYSSSFYKYMLSFSDTIRELTDMSSLWYREFYLEMTKCIQFPISHSMPWIMTEFLIKTPSMKENMFFPMDIYNDAAAKALFVLRQQFLYDEIEAELNLSFDQLIFHVSEDIFKYHKTVASSVLINKSYEITYFNNKKNRANLINSRYTALMSQRTITLLGRSVDLQYLISQQVNGYLRKNIEYVIRRFESMELTSVVELHQLLENVKFTHMLLADHLNLDAFDEMLKEINEDTSVGQFRGRIVLHILEELINDIIPNFIYNDASQRFVRGPHSFIQPVDRVRGPSNVASHYWYGRKFGDAFNRLASLYKGYFGIEHVESMFYVLDYREWPLIIDALTSETEHKIIYDFAPYAKALIEGMPPMKLPRLAYGVLGGYGFFDLKLKTSIGAYGPLKPQVFQYMKEVGNILLFVRLLEMIQNKHDDLTFQQTSFCHNIHAHPPRMTQGTSVSAQAQIPIPEQPFIFGTESNPVLTPIQQTFTLLAQNLRHRTDQPLMQYTQQAAEHALRMYAYEPEKTSLFACLVGRLSDLINTSLRPSLLGQPPREGILDVETPKDVARLFSCLQFIFCQPPDMALAKAGFAVINDMATFGEGWLWTQALFIHCLGLRSRWELLDFSYHVTKIDALQPLKNTVDPKASKKNSGKITDQEKQAVLIMEFIRNVKTVRETNNTIFSSLESYYPVAKPAPFACRVPGPDEKYDAPIQIGSGGHSHQPSMQIGAGGHTHQPSMAFNTTSSFNTVNNASLTGPLNLPSSATSTPSHSRNPSAALGGSPGRR